ncbi:MAG TPA: DUF4258 domain-containing protein [Gemmataceae bacterium]|jgi:hypothetical protein|nr:DUF4258 domain-containing protein [Gemmataceae bacterium]
MAKLFQRIQQLVATGRYVVGEHAAERLAERGLLEWQVVAGLAKGKLIIERPRDKPNPAIEVREVLPDGTECKAVWSHLRQSDVAKLVTVHFFDEIVS